MHIGCLTDIDYILILDQGGKDFEEDGDIAQLRWDIEIEGELEGSPTVLFTIIVDPYSIGVVDGVAETEWGIFFGLEVDDLVVGWDLILWDELHDHILVDIVALVIEDYCDSQKVHQLAFLVAGDLEFIGMSNHSLNDRFDLWFLD